MWFLDLVVGGVGGSIVGGGLVLGSFECCECGDSRACDVGGLGCCVVWADCVVGLPCWFLVVIVVVGRFLVLLLIVLYTFVLGFGWGCV